MRRAETDEYLAVHTSFRRIYTLNIIADLHAHTGLNRQRRLAEVSGTREKHTLGSLEKSAGQTSDRLYNTLGAWGP